MSKRPLLSVSVFAVLLLVPTAFAADNLPGRPQDKEKPSVKPVRQVAPEYPEEAQDRGVEGRVRLEVTVKENGEVGDAKVLSGHRLLNQAALDAIKQWRFSNTYGAPVTIEITFRFGDSDADPPVETNPALKVLHKVNAVYPEEAKRKKIQGEVAVDVTVNEKGEVTGARVKSGDEALGRAAVDAVKQFRFTNSAGKTVAATITFNFVLGDKDK